MRAKERAPHEQRIAAEAEVQAATDGLRQRHPDETDGGVLSREREFQAQRAIAEAEVEALADEVHRRSEALNNQEFRMNDDVLWMQEAEANVRRHLAAEAEDLALREDELRQRGFNMTEVALQVQGAEANVQRLRNDEVNAQRDLATDECPSG